MFSHAAAAGLGTCGPRIGEAVAANVGDVDRKRRRLRIPKSKNGEARDVPILPEVLALLDLDRDPAEPLFVSPRGKRLNADNWRSRVFAKAVEAAGLPPMDVHDLRHTAASLMIASGASVKDVQYALGHKSAKVTLDLYGHRVQILFTHRIRGMVAFEGVPKLVAQMTDDVARARAALRA